MTAATEDRWILTKHRWRDDGWSVVLLWAGFAVFVFVMVLVIAGLRGPIEISGWEIGSQLPRWYVGALGVYATAVYLPLYVAHGYARREIARQLPPAAAATVVLLAALMTLGYAIERGIYAAAGWSQELTQSHLYSTPTDYPLVFLEFLLLFSVWLTAGSFVGAGIYRNPGHGLYVIPLGLLMIGAAETVLSPGFFEVLTAFVRMIDLEGVSTTAAVLVSTACVAVGLPLTWLFARDTPLRNPKG